MNIETTRFGSIDIGESEPVTMKGPILGFPQRLTYVLLLPADNTPLWWLQSCDEPSLAFVVVNPGLVQPGYAPAVPEDERALLDIAHPDEQALLAIVTVRANPFRVTANLRAPLLINARNRMAKQIVLEDPAYPIQYDMLAAGVDVDGGTVAAVRAGTARLGKPAPVPAAE